MRFRGVVLSFALVLVACSSMRPVPIAAGDICFRCRRVINDPQMAAEMVDAHGLAFKFRTVGCMAKFLKANPGNVGAVYVTDYGTKRMIKASGATFVPTVLVDGYQRTPDYIAYQSSDAAREPAVREKSAPTDWKSVLAAAE